LVRDTLAANLRRERNRRGLSLSELSRLSKIGKATLSQLESATGNPTIETVFSLSRALEMPISDLLDDHFSDAVTVVRAAEAEVLSGEGVDLRPLRRIEAGGVIIEVYDQQVRADARQPSLGHAGTEHTVVQTGELTAEVNGHRVQLGPGDYIAFDASLPHCYTAQDGPVRSVLLLQYRSGQQEQDTPGTPHQQSVPDIGQAAAPATGKGPAGLGPRER
jgi:transcriptional regulator with XRE-family HTH domain